LIASPSPLSHLTIRPLRYDAEGQNTTYNAYSNTGMTNGGGAGTVRRNEVKTIGQIKDENIGMSDKQEYFSTKATINFVKHETFSYPACSTEGCNKKVTEEGNGWRCEKCDMVFPQPLYRSVVYGLNHC
jgi:replication factor A1